MSYLDQLINELCPDGVEYRKLEDFSVITRGNGLQKSDFVEHGVGCIHYGQIHTYYKLFANETVSFVTTELAGKLKKVRPGNLIVAVTSEDVQDVCKCIAWLGDYEIVTGGHTAIIEHTQNPKYLSYFFQSFSFFEQKQKITQGTKVIEVTPSKLGKVIIPLPPLPVQEEIVRILDKFTALEAELEAELEARKKQYFYYRNKLISENNLSNEMKLIDMLCQPITDGPHTTPELVRSGIPFISVEAVWDGKIHFDYMRGYITEEFNTECCKKYTPRKHDVYMVKSGSTTGKVAYVDSDIRFNIWSPLAAMRVNDSNSSRFLFHLLQTSFIQSQIVSKASNGSQPNLGMRVLEQLDVKAPPLYEQNRISAILDRFDALVNDITQGIPAELAARRRQYEYYRDKLLTFKEKVS